MHPSIFFRDFDEMPMLEQKALVIPNGKILDIGAAAGCHSLWLQNAGFDVTALEISEKCCEVMHQRGIEKVVHSGVESYSTSDHDYALLLMNGLGMAKYKEELTGFLMKVASLLKPGGRIIGDSTNILYFYEEEDGSLALPSDRYFGEVTFELEYEGLLETFDWMYPDPELLEDSISEAGLVLENLHHGTNGANLAVILKPS